MPRPPSAGYLKHRAKLHKRKQSHAPKRTAPQARTPLHIHAANDSRQFGEDTEHRAIEAFSSGSTPDWFLKVRPARPNEDRPGGFADGVAGVDLWVSTTRGEIPVQVKSSAERAKKFREAHPNDIAIVVLHRDMEDEEIRKRVVEAVTAVWRARAVRRAA